MVCTSVIEKKKAHVVERETVKVAQTNFVSDENPTLERTCHL